MVVSMTNPKCFLKQVLWKTVFHATVLSENLKLFQNQNLMLGQMVRQNSTAKEIKKQSFAQHSSTVNNVTIIT